MTDGMKSSEFWLVLAVIGAALLNGTDFINIPWEQFAIVTGAVGVYTGGRSLVKGMSGNKE